MKRILLTLLSVLFCAITFAQSVPQGINYQAVARDANGDVLMNQALTIQFSVISDITTSAVSWQETHQDTTNAYGLFTAIIGQGTPTNGGSSLTFDVIDWGVSNHFLKVEVDYGGGFVDMGTTAFMSVPYSMNALSSTPQSLTISGDTLFISSGNYIVLPSSTPTLLGCTDSTAFNYDSLANTDDGSCLINGCTDTTATNYNYSANNDDGSCTFSLLAIGDTYQGGIIFWLDASGGHGLISAPSDQSTGTQWGCYGLISGASGIAIGTGAQNTIDIVNANCSAYNSSNSIAANICANLTLGGYSDWFLPSKDELSQMYLNIGNGSTLGNIGGFAPTYTYYWSSSESNASEAHYQNIGGNGFMNSNGSKDTPYNYVRAVRAF